jgi:hypothetical protein
VSNSSRQLGEMLMWEQRPSAVHRAKLEGFL